jgi:hypothetical protein
MDALKRERATLKAEKRKLYPQYRTALAFPVVSLLPTTRFQTILASDFRSGRFTFRPYLSIISCASLRVSAARSACVMSFVSS